MLQHLYLARTIYFAIFDPYLRYGCQIWGQNKNNAVGNIEKLQNRAIRILNFKGPRAEANNLYKESKIYTVQQIGNNNRQLSSCHSGIRVYHPEEHFGVLAYVRVETQHFMA